MNTPVLGALPSPHDYRDSYATATSLVTAMATFLPPKYEEDFSMLGPVLDQNKEPACVAHSVALCLKHYFFQKTGKLIDFSPRFLDVLAKRFDGQPMDGGTYPRLVFKLAVKYGCATTKTVPNDTSLPIAQYRNDAVLTKAAFDEAAQYKIPGFLRIPDNFDAVRQAVYFHGAVSTLLRIGSEWWTPSWNAKDIDPLRTPAEVTGGHQVTTHGWKDERLNTLRNSWSVDWCDKGSAHYDYYKWEPFINEFWVVADIPEDLKNFLNHLPAPEDFHYEWDTDMKLGDNNEDVKFAQIALMILGFLAPVPAEELGIYGPKTANAVKAYQLAHRISPQAPNNIGPKTRVALNKQFSV